MVSFLCYRVQSPMYSHQAAWWWHWCLFLPRCYWPWFYLLLKVRRGELQNSGLAIIKEPTCQRRRHKRWRVEFLHWEDLLDEGMAIHSNILALRIPWTEEPGRLQSIVLQSQTGLKQFSMHTRKSLICNLYCDQRLSQLSSWDNLREI